MNDPERHTEPPKKNLVDLFASEKRPEQHTAMDRRIEKKWWTPRRTALVALAALFTGLVGYQLLTIRTDTLNVEAEKLTISEVTYGPFQEYIVEQGAVMPLTTIYLDAIEGGRVEEVFVEQGAQVQKGDPILRLSNANLQLNVMQREAELFEQVNYLRGTRVTMEQRRLDLRAQMVELDYQLALKKREYDRKAALVKENLIAQEDYEKTRDDYEYLARKREVTLETQRQDSLFRAVQIEQLEESIDRMRANLEVIRQNRENLTLRAPVAGLLSSLNAEIGESKSPGERLGQIDVEEGFKVRAAIDEHYIARVSPGQSGAFDFAGGTYDLTIRRVYPEVVEGQFQADMEFAGEAPQGLRRGQTLQVRIALGELADAVQVPRGGFYQKTGGQWIYVLDPSGAFAVKRPIKLGRQNSQYFEVLEGLQPGEKVITSMYDNFGDMERLVLK
jgi:HlyD family secretion protein